MKGLSSTVAAVLIVAMTVVITLTIGTFLATTAQRSAGQVESQLEQRIQCTYANFYIESGTIDCNLDCTRGVNHTAGVVLRNTGQVTLDIKGIYAETETGEVINFTGSYNLSPGEVANFTLSSYEACTSLVKQTLTSTGYRTAIKRFYVVSSTCPAVSDSLDENEVREYVSFIDCNQTESKSSIYGVLLYHFNETAGTTIYDSSGNGNNGVLYGSYEWIV
jgi:hypothetical protein